MPISIDYAPSADIANRFAMAGQSKQQQINFEQQQQMQRAEENRRQFDLHLEQQQAEQDRRNTLTDLQIQEEKRRQKIADHQADYQAGVLDLRQKSIELKGQLGQAGLDTKRDIATGNNETRKTINTNTLGSREKENAKNRESNLDIAKHKRDWRTIDAEATAKTRKDIAEFNARLKQGQSSDDAFINHLKVLANNARSRVHDISNPVARPGQDAEEGEVQAYQKARQDAMDAADEAEKRLADFHRSLSEKRRLNGSVAPVGPVPEQRLPDQQLPGQPQQSPRPSLDLSTAVQILEEAVGDRNLAKQIAAMRGFDVA